MTDIEKVIENLERMLSNYDMLDDIVINKNNEMLMFHRAAAKSALELLKEQRKTGEWIDHTFTHGDDIECPFCHKKWNVIDNCTETFDYCPGCGAKLS